MVSRLLFRRFTPQGTYLLQALARGATLKAHRHLDGAKIHKLHALDGSVQTVDAAAVRSLVRRRLIDSNKKFPAATYLLTAKGRRLAQKLVDDDVRALSARVAGPR